MVFPGMIILAMDNQPERLDALLFHLQFFVPGKKYFCACCPQDKEHSNYDTEKINQTHLSLFSAAL